jgi:cathepsin A (carboxypeptidase C)
VLDVPPWKRKLRLPSHRYAGDQDYICNWLGNQAWTNAMGWPFQTDFQAAPYHNWTAPSLNTSGGALKSTHGFSFLRVYNAGQS